MHIIAYLQMFASFWCAAILYFFPNIITYKTFALVTAVWTALVLAYSLVKTRYIIKKTTFLVACASALLLLLYGATAIRYNTINPTYNSFLLVIAGQLVPGIITSTFVSCNAGFQTKIKRLTPVVGAIFTFIALMGVLFPTSVTSGGFTDNENGLNYQNISYMAAYTSALWQYVLITKDKDCYFVFFHKFLGKIVVWTGILINLFIVFLAGGRGGFVTFVIVTLFSIFMAIRKNKLTVRRLAQIAGGITAIGIGAYFTIRLASQSAIQTSGIFRILEFLSGDGDSGRVAYWSKASKIFWEHPIWGCGPGSIFYEIGIYSHNLFTDALVEMGLVGLLLLLGALYCGFKKSIAIIKNNVTDSIWIYLFICGFAMAMFSGYWLGNFLMWWALIFLVTYMA